MTLRVIGAGLPRTGTHSLKLALERLLGAPCHHMVEVFQHPEQAPVWSAAAHGTMPDWKEFLSGYAAAVDWPSASFYPEIMEAFPDALVVLSVRDTQSWWESVHGTIFQGNPNVQINVGCLEMIQTLLSTRLTADIQNEEACKAAFERHNAQVRATVPPERLLEFRAIDGWEPLCNRLRVPVPADPYPRSNTREDWAARRAAPHRALQDQTP